MRNRVVFIDESGVVGGASQPLFVLGALKIADTAALTHGLTRVRRRVCGRHGTALRRFEFRLSAITERTAGAYAEAVTLESHASLLIQLVDVVDGAVCHAEARRRGYPQGTGTPKAAVADEGLALLAHHGDDRARGGGPSRLFVVRTAPEEQVRRKQ